MRDAVDADRAAGDSGRRPAVIVDDGIVPVSVDEDILSCVPIREVVASPDQRESTLIFEARHAWIRTAVRADAVRGPVIQRQAFEEQTMISGHDIEEHFI